MNNTQIADLISRECKNKNIKTSELLQYCNINHSFISDMRHKNRAPSVDKISAIADYLGVSVDYLLGRTNEPDNIQSTQQQDQVTTELLKVFENLSFKDKISVLNYALNIEESSQILKNKPQDPQIVQSKMTVKETPASKSIPYVARTTNGQNARGFLNLTDEDLAFLEANRITDEDEL